MIEVVLVYVRKAMYNTITITVFDILRS